MARPTKLNAEWFTHTADLRNDRRIKAIRTATGPAGYGILHMLLETLTDADNTTFSVDAFEVELLAGDFGTTAEEIAGVLSVGKKVGYFLVDEAQMLTCPELNKWLEMHFEKRNRSRNRGSGDSLPQPVTETGVPVTETPHNTLHNTTEHNSKDVLTLSSLRSEGAATAAAPAEKKIEAVEPQSESPDASASHTRGAADVPTRKKTKRPRPEPGPATVTAYRLPDWATDEFTQRLEEWLVRRQSRGDCRPLQADSIQARIDELAEYDEAFCLNLFRQAKQNPHWQGLTFDNTPHKFTQHIQALQSHAARSSTPLPGAKPTEHAAFGARALSAQLRAIREQRDAQVGSVVHLGPATGPHPGQGAPLAPGVRTPQG